MKREPRASMVPLHIFEQYLRHLRIGQARLLAERERYVPGDGRRDMTAEIIAQVDAEIATIEGTLQALTVEQGRGHDQPARQQPQGSWAPVPSIKKSRSGNARRSRAPFPTRRRIG